MFWAEIWKLPEFYIWKFSFFGGKILKIFEEACFYNVIPILPGIKLQGDWGEIVALEGSKSVFATFEKASTCAKRTFCWEKSSEKWANMQRLKNVVRCIRNANEWKSDVI